MEHKHTLRDLMRVRLAKFAAVVLGVTIVMAVFAPWLAPYDPVKTKPWDSLHPPSSQYWLGADRLGRDQLSRLIYGARVSLLIGVGGVGIAVLLGMFIGVTAGWYSGLLDELLMRLMDGLSAFPALLLALSLVAITGSTVLNIILVVAVVGTPWVARVIRSQVLSLRERDFVRLAIVAGCSKKTIMRRHILPNVVNSAVVLGTLMLGVVIVTEAALSFLGVGVPPPKPAWGLMLADGKKGLMAGYWWLTVLPGLCIMFMVLSANLIGDWLRVKLDPQLRQL